VQADYLADDAEEETIDRFFEAYLLSTTIRSGLCLWCTLFLAPTIGEFSLIFKFNSVGDSPRGPLKQLGNPHLKPATSQSQTRLA
jgi:hypothetical protein